MDQDFFFLAERDGSRNGPTFFLPRFFLKRCRTGVGVERIRNTFKINNRNFWENFWPNIFFFRGFFIYFFFFFCGRIFLGYLFLQKSSLRLIPDKALLYEVLIFSLVALFCFIFLFIFYFSSRLLGEFLFDLKILFQIKGGLIAACLTHISL